MMIKTLYKENNHVALYLSTAAAMRSTLSYR